MLKKSVTKSKILDKISTFHIFKRYAPPFTANKLFFGDIGRTKREKAPSANIIYINKDFRYIDFAIGSFSAFDYVMAKYNLSFVGALEKIDEDFGLGIAYNAGNVSNKAVFDYKSIVIPEAIEKPRKIIKIKVGLWGPEEIDFWKSVGWTSSMIVGAKIVPIGAYWITDNNGDWVKHSLVNELAFAYQYYTDGDGIFQYKLYFPNRKEFRWVSNVNSTTVQNIKNIPRNGDLLFISSSLKDCGQTSRLAGYFNSIAGNNEGSFIPDKVFYKLKLRFKRIILWLDNDDTGIRMAKKFGQIYDLDYIHNPIGSPKDQSALWKDIGGNGFNRIMNQQLKLIGN